MVTKMHEWNTGFYKQRDLLTGVAQVLTSGCIARIIAWSAIMGCVNFDWFMCPRLRGHEFTVLYQNHPNKSENGNIKKHHSLWMNRRAKKCKFGAESCSPKDKVGQHQFHQTYESLRTHERKQHAERQVERTQDRRPGPKILGRARTPARSRQEQCGQEAAEAHALIPPELPMPQCPIEAKRGVFTLFVA